MKSSYTQSTAEVFNSLETSAQGLTTAEAQTRLAQYGKNQLATVKKQSWLARFFAQFKDIMIILLLISAVISLVFGILEKNGITEFIDTIIIAINQHITVSMHPATCYNIQFFFHNI